MEKLRGNVFHGKYWKINLARANVMVSKIKIGNKPLFESILFEMCGEGANSMRTLDLWMIR